MNSSPSRFFAICRMKSLIIGFILATGMFSAAFGQIKAAKYEMAQYNYPKAIELLHQFIQTADPGTKSEATLLMADCYRLENNMQDARTWYFKAIKLGNTDALTYFYYGKALRACGDYEAAKKIFLRYDSLMPEDHRGKIYASFCDSAMAWDEKPFAFEVNNAKHLNSASSDFGPVFYKDGVIFATDRTIISGEAKESGLTGEGFLKLVFSKPKQKGDYYGDYTLPKVVPEFYTNGTNIGPATFSKDGNEVFVTRTFKSNLKSKDETEDGQSNQMKIFYATKNGESWSKMKPFFFNNNNYSVGYPALSPDGKSLYFVSDVDGGHGGTDIYVSTREGGEWSTPVNLGSIVNTFGNETLPFIADNGDLYFASDGHPGYGGLDLFVTRKVGNAWMIPQNLGKPINSSYDDFALAMYQNDSVGLFSANRPGGRGEDDIYTFRVVGPLPALNTQPVLADVPNGVQKPATRTEANPGQTSSNPRDEKTVPAPEPATTQAKNTADEQKVVGDRNFHVTSQETTYENGKLTSVSAPAKVEGKTQVQDQNQNAQQNVPVAQNTEKKTTEKSVPAASATTQTKTPYKEQKVVGQRNFHVTSQETTYENGKVASVSSPASVEGKTQVHDQNQNTQQHVPITQNTVQKPAEMEIPITLPEKQESKPSSGLNKQGTIQNAGPAASGTSASDIMVSGCIKDGLTKDPVPAATLFFLDETKGLVFVHKANAGGCFRSRLISGDNYQVKAMKSGYSSACMQFNSSALNHQTEATIPDDFILDRVGTIHSSSLVDNIYYDYNRYFIRPDAEPTLNKIVKILNENPITVELGSHADCRGTQDYNMALTEKRAASAVHYLVQKGIKASRITSKWYGKAQVVNNCNCAANVSCTEDEHQLNRRTEFKLSLPSVSATELPINLDKFREGDTIPSIYLPEDFFQNCSQHLLSGPLAELLDASSELLAQNQNTGLKYTVQIGAFSYLTPNFKNMCDVMSCKGSDGILRCFVGQFSSLEEATWFRDHLRSGEFKDAFVAVMDEKHNPSGTGQEILLSKR